MIKSECRCFIVGSFKELTVQRQLLPIVFLKCHIEEQSVRVQEHQEVRHVKRK